jgi:mercuric reductase
MQEAGEVELQLEIQGMHCAGCAAHVRKALEQVSGVLHVELPDWQARQAFVRAAAGIRTADLVEAVEKVGYGARLVQQRAGQAQPGEPAPRHEDDYDLLTIGGGSAAFAAAIRAAELGARVAIVEKGTLGGTCVNFGCVPSKTLIRAAQLYAQSLRPRFPGLPRVTGQPAWGRLIAEKNALVTRLREQKYRAVAASYGGIHLLEGEARLLDGHRVAINGRVYRPGKILLATGSRPWAPPIPGLEAAGYLDSTAALDLQTLPSSLLVLGGGAIGLELAQMFARVGVRVAVLEALPRIVANEEPEISQALTEALTAEGIAIHTGVCINRVERSSDGYAVHAVRDGQPQCHRADQLLVATGRRPATEGLGLEQAGVERGPRGEIVVNDFLQTANPRIYAAGDCLGEPMFVYVAAQAGSLAAQNALGEERRPRDLSVVPRVTFTDPQVASVGLRQADAEQAGFATRTALLEIREVPRAIVDGEAHGVVKLVADAGTGRLLGAHILAANAGDIIGEATLAIRYGLRVEDLIETLHPYLTMTEALRLAALAFERDVSRLSCCAS